MEDLHVQAADPAESRWSISRKQKDNELGAFDRTGREALLIELRVYHCGAFRNPFLSCLTIVFALIGASNVRSDDWPQWRGPKRDNISRETGLLKEWPDDGPPLVWRVGGVGEGIASVSVAAGHIYTVGYHEGGEFVSALELQSGERVWATRIGPVVRESSLMRWLVQRSPTIDGDRLYAITAGGVLSCLRVSDGQELWKKDYIKDFGAARQGWGFGDYPLVDGERLICTPVGRDASVVALDKRSGKVIWKTDADGSRSTYAATVVADVDGVRQYVTFLNRSLVGVRASDGQLLWSYDKVANSTANSYTPIVLSDSILSASGYGRRLALLKLARSDNGVKVHERYLARFGFDPFQDSTVVVGDFLYSYVGPGRPICIEWKTGKTVWGPLPATGRGKAAITYADGRLYLRHSLDGRMTLAEATPKAYAEKGTFLIPDHERSRGSTFPVIAGGHLYLRDNNRLFCYDIRAGTLDKPRPEPRTIVLSDRETKAQRDANGGRSRTGPRSVFVPTPQDVVEKMLELARIQKRDVVYDLGSGDGRIVITAAKKYGCSAVGYELDPELVDLSRFKAMKSGFGYRVRIVRRDLFTADLQRANVVALYLLPKQLQKLVPQLEKLKPGSRIVSHQFPIPDIESDKVIEVESKEDGTKHKVYLWTTPLKKAEGQQRDE